jgi:hypothetical protein
MSLVIRQFRKNSPPSEGSGDRVIFSTKAHVRKRASRIIGMGWVTLGNTFGGPHLIVRTASVEISLPLLSGRFTPPGSLLRAGEASMWIEEIQDPGSSAGKTKWIRLLGEDDEGKIELAVNPESSFDDTWQALLNAGVSPVPRPY